MAPEMYRPGDYTGAVDVSSFLPIVHEALVGLPALDAGVGRYVLMSQVTSGVRPQLPESVDAQVADLIRQGWPMDPVTEGSFEGILGLCGRLPS
jgi:hypothetical protein